MVLYTSQYGARAPQQRPPQPPRTRPEKEYAPFREMPKIKEEEVLYKSHPCRRGSHMLKKYLLAAIVLILALYIYFDAGVYAYISSVSPLDVSLLLYGLLGLFVLIVLVAEIKRYSITYTITRSRVVAERGVFSRKVDSLHLSIMDTINVKSNFIDRILRMGDLEVGVIDNRVVFEDIHSPHVLEDYLTKVMNDYKRRHIVA